MATPMTVNAAAPTGVTAQYFGAIGTTDRYYWVQAIYPFGRSVLQGAPKVTTGGLDNNNRVSVEWNSMAGAIGYNVFRTTTSTAPTNGASIYLGTTNYPTFVDNGITAATGLSNFVIADGLKTARARYDFAIDGDPIGPGLITLANSDTIPAGAIIVAAILNSTTAFTGTGATVAVGTSAGSAANSIKTATAITSLTLDALLNGTVTFAAAVKMTAAGTITITSATAALTGGVLDIILLYVMPINL